VIGETELVDIGHLSEFHNLLSTERAPTKARIVSANLSDYMKEAQSEPITSDELLLEWALQNLGRPVETPSAQYVRADGALVYAIPLSNQLALLASDGSIALIADNVNAPTRTTFSPDGIRRYAPASGRARRGPRSGL